MLMIILTEQDFSSWFVYLKVMKRRKKNMVNTWIIFTRNVYMCLKDFRRLPAIVRLRHSKLGTSNKWVLGRTRRGKRFLGTILRNRVI